MTDCPVCSLRCEGGTTNRDSYWFDCSNCGRYEISRTTHTCISRLDERQRAVLSHGIWLGHQEDLPFTVTSEHLRAAETRSLPNPGEQLSLLLLFIGDQQEGSPGRQVLLEPSHLRAKVGAQTVEDIQFLDDELRTKLLLGGPSVDQLCGGRLTMEGWLKYEQLKKGQASSRTAFVAMPFGNETVVQIVDEVFRLAVEETGFRLKRVDDEPSAGSIVNRIRVEILTSRFVITDLTDNNNGAYWEAGFAEGLNKPVVYTCLKSFFENPGTHFDICQSQCVLWDPHEPDRAAGDLKAVIRATLPFEAKMEEER